MGTYDDRRVGSPLAFGSPGGGWTNVVVVIAVIALHQGFQELINPVDNGRYTPLRIRLAKVSLRPPVKTIGPPPHTGPSRSFPGHCPRNNR